MRCLSRRSTAMGKEVPNREMSRGRAEVLPVKDRAPWRGEDPQVSRPIWWEGGKPYFHRGFEGRRIPSPEGSVVAVSRLPPPVHRSPYESLAPLDARLNARVRSGLILGARS
jgi:hypothetical protein